MRTQTAQSFHSCSEFLEVRFDGDPDFLKVFFANVISCSLRRGFASLFLDVKYLPRSSLE